MVSKDTDWTGNSVTISLILKYHLDLEVTFIILDICAELFVNSTSGSKDIEQTRKRDR